MPSPSLKYALLNEGMHICLAKMLIIMFPLLPIWLQDSILKMSSANPGNILYRQTSNIRHTLLSNIIVDNSYVDGASPVGAAPTTSELST